jgi:DNA-binding NarL/FixJ family response regulator
MSHGDIERALDAAFRTVIGTRPAQRHRTAKVARKMDARNARADLIVALRAQGLKQREIAKELNISQSAVSYHLRKWGGA